MTLDLILFRPEFFLLFSFFVLLWYGTGNYVTPVAEIRTVTNYQSFYKKENRRNVEKLTPIISNKCLRSSKNRGPAHPASGQTLWAVVWCFLSFLLCISSPMHTVFWGGSFQKDAYSLNVCRLLFLSGVFVLRVSHGWQKIARICHTEYVYQAMLALIGQYQQIMATNQMSVYLCLELQSFSLVVLCGLNSKSAYSLEAAMKYFLLSAFRSCLVLVGIGFVYWQTGETSLPHIEKIVERKIRAPSLFTALGIWLISTGLLWKQAAAPLHFWVPDVYMGAWSSVSLWITVQPKIAVLGFWTHHWHAIWSMSFGSTQILFRAFSMIVGRIAPLAQTNIKRLLAYSSVGHMGLLLMPLCGNQSRIRPIRNSGFASTEWGNASEIFMGSPADSIGVLWAYMIIYVIINVGVWGMQFWPIYRPVSLFRRKTTSTTREQSTAFVSAQNSNPLLRSVDGVKEEAFGPYGTTGSAPQFLWDLKGQNKTSARAAFRWAVFMTSLAGLPPVYSFLGKAAIIWHRVTNGLFILVAVALRYTMIGSVYYLKVMKIAYVDNRTRPVSYGKVSPLTAYIIAISVFVILIGLWRGNSQFQATHMVTLSVSNNPINYLFFLFLFNINDFCLVLVCLHSDVWNGDGGMLLEPT